MALTDTLGRSIRYLRLSVFEQCNFRCDYCRPERGGARPDRTQVLSDEELTRLVGLFVGLGVRRVRLTGGEPLLRPGLTRLARLLKALPGLEDLALSTNAHRLADLAGPLAEAGVDRVNISLDSLDPATFARITRGGVLAPVLAGIDAALAAGLKPVKVNMVVMGGVNDHEIGAMLDFATARGLVLRFIETMPIGAEGTQATRRFVSAAEILQAIETRFGCVLGPGGQNISGAGPARYYRLHATGADIGVISALSQHFCETCNRVRVTSTGRLILCLGQEGSVDLGAAMRAGSSDADLETRIMEAIAVKPRSHGFSCDGSMGVAHSMTALGG